MPTPLVTVLLDTYNHERFIEQAIASVLEQDFPSGDVEILVVDDGSTDRTPEIVRKFDARVRRINHRNSATRWQGAMLFAVGTASAWKRHEE